MELLNRIKLCWKILRADTGNLYSHAARELPPAGDDEMQALMNRGLLDLVLVFSTQGHSGFSAGYATSALAKLLRYEPLGPLTGDESEWVEVSKDMWQNNRCGRVFKEADGSAYDIDDNVFREPDGCTYASRESRVPVVFPYRPATVVVDVPEPTP